jgi:hypothetical protein
MKTFWCILTFISGLVLRMEAQPVMVPDSITKNAMEKLGFLSGHWSGTGSIQMGREKHGFNQEETVSQKVNNSVLVIDGLGIDAATNQVVHQAYAVISYDRSASKYLMRAFRGDGNYIDADAMVEQDGSFVWGFTHPQAGRMKYTIRMVNGQWVEKGEMSRDNATWFPFFEMTLSKK